MNRYLCIFFLYSACYGISVSQLEQLQKARKDIAVALNQYNEIAQLDSKQINAWKKTIQGYLAIIKQFDPHGAKELHNSMIDATFQAVDRIIEQKKSLSKTAFLQKERSKQTTEKPIKGGMAQSQQTTEKLIEADISQPQPPEKVISVESQKINAIKNEIEHMIQLYRQSDDWYNVFEAQLKKIDAKDADAYRARVPQRKVSRDIRQDQRGEMIVHGPQSKEPILKDVVEQPIEKPLEPVVVVIPVEPEQAPKSKPITPPQTKAKKEQSIDDTESKKIDEPQSKEPISHEVAEQPVKKPITPPQTKTKQEQSIDDTESKKIDEPQSKEPISHEVAEQPVKKPITLPQTKTKQEQSMDDIKSKKIDEPQSKEPILHEVVEQSIGKPLDPVVIIPVEPEKPTESKSPPITPVIEIVPEVKHPLEGSGSGPKTDKSVNGTESSPEIKQEPLKSKPLEPSKSSKEDIASDDDYDFALDINNV